MEGLEEECGGTSQSSSNDVARAQGDGEGSIGLTLVIIISTGGSIASTRAAGTSGARCGATARRTARGDTTVPKLMNINKEKYE